MRPTTPSNESIDLGRYSLEVVWDDTDAQAEFRLDQVDVIHQMIVSDDLWADTFWSDCDDLIVVLEALAPLAVLNFDEIEVNGVTAVVADSTEHERCFVPHSEAAGVEVLQSSSSSWETGGPCIFDQSERLLRFGDLYWVETRGDLDQQTVAVGQYTDANAGIAAAATASIYFTLDTSGKVTCELDDWPQYG